VIPAGSIATWIRSPTETPADERRSASRRSQKRFERGTIELSKRTFFKSPRTR
jgi:hypothetical protein